MSLEFRPFVAINPNETSRTQKGMEQLNQTFNNIGTQAMQYRQQQIENARQQQLMDIQQQTARQQWEANQPLDFVMNNYSSQSGPSMNVGPQGPMPSASLQQGTQGPQPNPNYQNAQGGSSYQQGTGAPVDHTQHFQNWMQMGQPSSYDHPDYGGSGQNLGAASNPMFAFDPSTYMHLPGSQRQSYLSLAEEQRKMREEQDKYGTGASGLYSTPEQAAFQLFPSDPKKQQQYISDSKKVYPNGRIPKSSVTTTAGGVHFDVTHGEHEDQFNKKRITALGDALDPSKQRAGAFGVSKQVYDRAERLESLAKAFRSGNQLRDSEIEEMAIGLNAMLSGANTGAQAQVKALVPNTIWGDAQKMKQWLANAPQGMQQGQFVDRMLGSIGREKSTASDQIKRTQYQRIARYNDVRKTNPDDFNNQLLSNGIDPDEYDKWVAGGSKPMTAVQNPEDNTNANQSGSVPDGSMKVLNGQRYEKRGGQWYPAQ